MINLEMLLGELVHQYIEKVIKSDFNKNLISEKIMFNNILLEIEEVIDKSFRDYNRWYEKPSKNKNRNTNYYNY